jgi:GT2 family glycosyltransferase
VFGFPQESFIKWGFAATANLFTTRAAVHQVGLFDERMMSGGDMEWGQSLRSRGLAQAYADDVRVSHPARRTLGQLCRKTLRVAGGNQQLANRRGEGTAGLLVYAWRQLIQLRRTRANLADGRLRSRSTKLKFAAVVWVVDLLRTLERYRVYYGGAPSRT